MKKIIFVLLLMIIPTITASAQFIPGNYLSNTYVMKEKGNYKKYEQMQFIVNKKTNEIVYCLEAFDTLTGNYIYNIANKHQDLALPETIYEKVKAITYFGYGYEGHNEEKWYAATQILIWKTIEQGVDIYFTKTLNGQKDYDKYSDEINEIETLANEYLEKSIPKSYTVYKNQELIINNYQNEIINTSLSYKINNNQLILTGEQTGTMTLTTEYNYYSNDVTAYYHSSDQNVIKAGNIENKLKTINIHVEEGTIRFRNINEFDELITDSSYGIYDENNNLIKELNNEQISLPNYGKYYIKEIKAGIGYEQNNQVSYFEITSNNLDQETEIISKKIKAKLIVTKYYEDYQTKYKELEDNQEFGLYNQDNILIKTYQTLNGMIEDELYFGKYILKQHTTLDNYYLSEDIEIEITSNKTINIEIINQEIVKELIIEKRDIKTKELIKQSGISFNIIKDNEILCLKDQCEFKTNEEGLVILPSAIDIGVYQILELDKNLGEYIHNKIPIQIEITKSSEDIVIVKFYNELITKELIKPDDNSTYVEIPDTYKTSNIKIKNHQFTGIIINKKKHLFIKQSSDKIVSSG